MIVGTAGHIDHGKTSLVRALTGVDTDRLKEEKARGITIDLGFAYIPGAEGTTLGFVDVPGHERLVHTMIAGAASIGTALLVIAADDGVMPQTREHLHILSLLGINDGVVAVTKIDLVDQNRVDDVKYETWRLLEGTPFADAPIFSVSSTTGRGLDALKCWLIGRLGKKRSQVEKAFRLAVDRSFSLAGAGTIVTGSVIAGEIVTGDEVMILPGGQRARIRSIHAMNRPSDRGVQGDRCALNLKGPAIHHDCIRRGDWIVSPSNPDASARCDVLLEYLDSERKPLRHWTPVQLHHGARQVDARVVLLETDALQPGGSGLAQLVVSDPQPFRHEDRIILRDTSAQRTIAGAKVLDPAAPDRNRRRPERLSFLRAAAAPGELGALRSILQQRPYLASMEKLLRDWGLTEHGLETAAAGILRLPAKNDTFLALPERLEELRAAAVEALDELYAREPILPGATPEVLRLAMRERLPRPQFEALLGWLLADEAILSRDSLLCLPEHEARIPESTARMQTRVRELLSQSPFRPPRVAEMAKAVLASEQAIRKLCKQLARAGLIVEVAPDHFLLRSAVRDSARVAALLSDETNGAFTVAQFRDRVGNGRQLAVQILNYLDRRGITQRRGDTRRLAKEPDLALGHGASSW